ncbi:MAG: ABC transporter permease [bacterium]
MIRFLLKGLLRDRHRSLFPVLIVTIGVILTVLVHCWITGVIGDVIDYNARFSTGHVKVMTRAYAENMDQTPNDLALLRANELLDDLHKAFPSMIWVQRTRFGGLLDAPDERGETKAQGPVMGLAVDLLSGKGDEIDRLNIRKALMRGKLPQISGEILVSDEFAAKLAVRPGDAVTLIGSTMNGSMAMQNFAIAGTVQFGVSGMDRGAMIVDISDAQQALDMEDASGEILGFFRDGLYNDMEAQEVVKQFYATFGNSGNPGDEFAPIMLSLKEQNDLASMFDYVSRMIGIIIFVFVFAMCIVLWNAGLINGLRRYGEVGLRLAIGEDKGGVYRSLIYESVAIGIAGSVCGTLIGLGFAYILQTKGIDIGSMMKSATMMMPNVFRAHITSRAYYIGFIPGLFSTVLGTMLSGIGIYRRKTAQLFKELEV